MKRAIFFTALVLLANRVALYLYDLIQSPLAGTANAQQLTDTWTGYATSRFFTSNPVEGFVLLFTVLALMAIWGFTLFSSKKQCLDPDTEARCKGSLSETN